MASRIYLLRHAEREDHVNPRWAQTAFRAHDSPLSLNGRAQAAEVGIALRELVSDVSDIEVYSSPLIRCCETTSVVLEHMGRCDLRVRVENGLAEDELHLRHRMMGTRAGLGPEATIAPDGRRRGECSPVLLGAGDVQAHIRPALVDLEYTSACTVAYDGDGHELDGDGAPRALAERCADAAQAIVRSSAEGSTLLLVGHGGVWKEMINAFGGPCTVDRERPVAYVELAELERVDDGDAWRLVRTVVLPSLRGDSAATKLA